MIFSNLKDFIAIIQNNKKRVLALDVSKKTIGIAVSDDRLVLALPLKNIVRSNFVKDVNNIKEIYNLYNCGGLVIGYPIMLNGEEGSRCQSIRDFTTLLLEHFETPVFFENEQFSTRAASSHFKQVKLKSKKPIDNSAATIFLQSLLDRLSLLALL